MARGQLVDIVTTRAAAAVGQGWTVQRVLRLGYIGILLGVRVVD
jgi:hypothetical protein